jgi:small subunit ribosomal protein S3
MGQKVNPNGFRLGVNKDWKSKWYSSKNDFADNLIRDIKIREFLEKKLKDAAVSNIVIERNNKRTNVKIYTARPGVVIGQGGKEIENLRNEIKKAVGEEVYVQIVEVKNPDMNAQLVADSIASQIENRASFRNAQKRAIRNTMKAGAKGIKTKVSGRLGGAEIARSEGYTEGTVPLHTLRANIDYATSEADTTYGKIGVKVWIYKGEILGVPSFEEEDTKSNNNRDNKKHFNKNNRKQEVKGGNDHANAKEN